jgi:isoleucyl-tRNA synthetase
METRLEILYKDVKKAKYTILEKIKGIDLKGIKYVPLFPYFASRENGFVVTCDSYVTRYVYRPF